MRRRVRRPTPVVRDGPMREALMRLSWMNAAALTDECQQVLRSLLPCSRPGWRDLPRVHQRRDVSGDEAVVDEDVFLDAKRRIQPLEIAGAVVDGAMTQRQVLRARRRADGIGLHESQPAAARVSAGPGETGCGRPRTGAGGRGQSARLNVLAGGLWRPGGHLAAAIASRMHDLPSARTKPRRYEGHEKNIWSSCSSSLRVLREAQGAAVSPCSELANYFARVVAAEAGVMRSTCR